MATPRLAKRLSELQQSSKARRLRRRERESRRLQLESLEDRRLMAVGPSLVAVLSNNGDFLDPGDTLNIAPRDLTFRFSQGASIDPSSISNGIQLLRSGGDNVFGNGNDVVVTPGFLGSSDVPREVVMRFAATLPDDAYRVTIFGAGTPLRDTSGNPFNGGVNQQIDFNLDLATKITAVVPQPITRVGNLLSQNARTIEVHFDQNELALSSVQNPGFYRLIDSTDGSPTRGSIKLPQSVTVVTDAATQKQKATLTFAADIPAGTFKLEIGTTYESDNTLSTARHVGNSMGAPIQAFIGDRVDGGTQNNDIDLYRYELRVGAPITATATPSAGLDAIIRVFDASGNEVAVQNNGGAGAAENLTTASLAAGNYYIGISSANNTAYNPTNGTTTSNGTSTGAYSLQVTFNDAAALNDVNSSFADAALNAALGTIGLAGRTITGAQISQQPYDIQFPGAGDAPGERNIPFESHIQTITGLPPDAFQGIREITYDFQLIYGFTPTGQPLSNAITEEQKQRVREVLELYGRYLGVQFREVTSGDVRTDMTIATGDPRSVAPTISTGTGDTQNGVNGVAGAANVPLGSLTSGVHTATTGTITGASANFAVSNAPIIITSDNHGLRSGDRVEISGVQGNTNANAVWTINVIDSNTFSLIGSRPNALYQSGGTWRLLDLSRGVAVMNALVNWGNSEYGGAYFRTAMHEIGHLLGLGQNFEAAALTIMAGEQTPSQAANRTTAEGVYPGDADIVYGQALHRPESRDIDLYQFNVTEAGLFRAETIAERLGPANSSLLNTVLTLYQEISAPGQPATRQIVARNDDYYGNDSYLELQLDKGTYYIGVTSVGNTEFDPTIANSGFGGRTQGAYNLKLEMKPDGGTSMSEVGGVKFDGDADNRQGGTYDFWFQSNTPATTIYVDKTSAAALPDGTLGRPFNNLPAALAAAASGPRKVVRIVGNGGTDGNINTIADNAPYLVGFRDLDQVLDQPLADGGTFLVPQGVTVMIDAGAVFKMRKANLNAGTTPQGLVTGTGGAIQVLGIPAQPVQFTSYADDTIGGDSDGPSAGPQGGDYGGIVFREDSDRELDGVFLNYVNNATMNYGGGRVTVDSVEDTYNPIHMAGARPAISYNSIQRSADAAMSADPNSFEDDGLRPNVAFDVRRIGPDIHDNTVGFSLIPPPAGSPAGTPSINLNNTVNGMFIRVKTLAGNPLDLVDLTTRWDDTDIVHVVSENLLISGTPGGSRAPDADRPATTLTDGRLRIDPGIIVKLSGSRIEATVSSQFIAEGTLENPIIFTSLRDDKYGAGGSFDTNRDAAATGPAPGQWGGLILGPASSGSLDRASVFYAGGVVPIEGSFDRFNAVEVHQADARITNSIFQFNDGGGSATDRNGRGANSNAVIFARGAQPIIVGNIIRDNTGVANSGGPAISINANAMQETRLADYGRATGAAARFSQFNDNHGPLVRENRMINNTLNGMEIRGGTLTTETVWDDTDIAHILRSEIVIPNHQVNSGLRLQSKPTESLVVKLLGGNAGFTASGRQLDIADRIGGSLYIMGQPGFPVVLTSLNDDSVPVGFNPSGLPIFDTNNNGSSTLPTGGDWRSVNLNQYSNDRNVAQVLEREGAYVGNLDTNATPATAQPLGSLAPNEKSGDDNRRLGFEVDGTISYNRPHDIDLYSFNADSGTEVWIDIDRTSYALDIMVELVDVNGNVLARATDTNPNAPIVNTTDPGLTSFGVTAQSFNKDHFNGRDTFTTNPRDAIMRVVLPAAANGTALKNVPYFVRVRSQPGNFTGESGNTLNPGLTSGQYQLQIRLNQKDEKAGSTVKFSDIRFATNGIEVHGLPYHSPLTGETAEADSTTNNTQGGAQFIGNLLRSDRNTLSVGGEISNFNDIDWYQFDLTFDLLEVVNGYTNGFKSWSTIFDIDYGDGLSRADVTLSVFDDQGRLILMGRDSDVQDDQGTAGNELTSGSFGKQDPYIGAVQLPAGNINSPRRTYYVAVTNNRQLPSVLNQTFNPTATSSTTRVEPIDSVARAVTDHFEAFINARQTSSGTAEFPENQYIDPNNPSHVSSSLIDTTTIQSLTANVKPYTLSDVNLFVTDGFGMYQVDAASGQIELIYNTAPGVVSGGNNGGRTQDIAFRSDGLLFGYEGGLGGVANTAGRLSQIDPEDGTSANVGNDGIPDLANPPPNPLNAEQITTNLGLGAAMALGGTVLNNLQNNTLLYYAIPEPNVLISLGPDGVLDGPPATDPTQDDVRDTVSRLYQANPTNGSAAVVQGQPWGRVGGLTNYINAPVPANASTTFGLTGAPVTVTFSSAQVGPAGNGTIVNFLTPTDPGSPAPPVIGITPASGTTPAQVDITLNTNASPISAAAATDFGTGFLTNGGTSGAALRLTAVTPGAAGNNIRVLFSRADLGFSGPTVDADPVAGTVTVVLNNGATSGQATNVFDLASAINTSIANSMISASAEGDSFGVTPGGPGTTLPPQVQLAGGASGGTGTTAADLVAAINALNSPVIRATLSGDGTVGIAQQIPGTNYPNPLTLTGGRFSVGNTTGMAFGSDEFTLYGVTTQGVFLSQISQGNAAPAGSTVVNIPDLANPGQTRPAVFSGLTRAPQNLLNGIYQDMFVATAVDDPATPIFEPTRLVALDTSGALQSIFDTNFDGVGDSSVITVQGLSSVTGLAFSPFDFNLWHPTYQRQADAGHGVGQSPTLGSQHFSLTEPSSGRGSDNVNMSFYFGFEQRRQLPGHLSSSYYTYPLAGDFSGTSGSGETGNDDLLTMTGQYGVLDRPFVFGDTRMRELNNNATNGSIFTGNYNAPGGAQGSLITDEFTLANLKTSDKPTVYFDYFLDTEDANFSIQAGGEMRDSARVYVGPFTRIDPFTGRSYQTWDLLATNNDVPDSRTTGQAEFDNPFWDGELPTFQSASVTAQPDNPRQQVQLLHDNTGGWRQARVDLSRYAGMANLQLRFDFATAGTVMDPFGQIPNSSISQAANDPENKEFLFENLFGDVFDQERAQNNQNEGWYLDNIIVGVAERGEMVIGAPVDTNFFTTPQPQDYDPTVPVPTEVTTGPYQLEIRRGAEYALSDGGQNSTITPILAFDTNERLIPDQRLAGAIPTEDFELGVSAGLDPALPWSEAEDAQWSIIDLSAGTIGGTTFGGASGTIIDGQRTGLEISLVTGDGMLEFDRAVFSQVGSDFLRLYIDGRVADINPDPQVRQAAAWSGDVPFSRISVPVTAGHHNFRWVYEKDAAGSAGLDRAFIDNVVFPTPKVGVQDIYSDPLLHDPLNLNGVNAPPPPVVPAPTSSSQIRRLDTLYRGFTRGGDQNLHREQGHIQIEQNLIVSAAQAGILVDAGVRDPNTGNSPIGSVRNLPTLNNERLAPGLTLANNVVANSGQVGIRFGGDANAPDAQGNLVPVAAVPFARIINNTIYGGLTANGTGIQIDANAGPSILNNIVANTIDGITVDATSTATTVVGANLFAGNSANGVLGTSAITLGTSDTLFVNPAGLNFYLQAGAQAIDSSINTLGDRPSISTVKSAVGIPPSPILAPDRDLFGQLRVDEPNVLPPFDPGLGQNIFKDRGAIERADFTRPFASIIDPLDNDSQQRDRNPNPNDVVVRNELLRQFVVKLNDTGVDIDDSLIVSSLFTITQDGVLLSALVDYEFVYNPVANEVIFTPTSGAWPLNHTYTIKIDNSATGVRDKAGNTLQGNRATGEVLFNIFTGIVRDFGDAPDPKYPTLAAKNGASHDVLSGFHLGAGVSEEQDGFQSANADGDSNDDGVTFVIQPSPGLLTTINVNASAPGILDAWFDLNRDGVWDASEKLINGRALTAGTNTLSFTYGNAQAQKGVTFARFRFSTTGVDTPLGVAQDGEVEDYRVVVGGPPFQNPNNPLDVNNSGATGVIDAILVINFLNFYSRVIPGVAIPLPPTSPPFPEPAPVIDPTGGGVPGQGRYFDVDGNGFLTPFDAILVINFLNNASAQRAAAEGESSAMAPAAAPPASTASALSADAKAQSKPALSVPEVLYATSGIVIEEREVARAPRTAPVQDAALLALTPEFVGPVALVQPQPRVADMTTRKAASDEPSWDELLTDLAADQKHLGQE